MSKAKPYNVSMTLPREVMVNTISSANNFLDQTYGREVGIVFKDIRNGRCNSSHKGVTISFPNWCLDRGVEFAVAYLCHEYAHALSPRKHNHVHFINTEDKLLSHFGLRILRSKAYAKAIYAHGELVFARNYKSVPKRLKDGE